MANILIGLFVVCLALIFGAMIYFPAFPALLGAEGLPDWVVVVGIVLLLIFIVGEFIWSVDRMSQKKDDPNSPDKGPTKR